MSKHITEQNWRESVPSIEEIHEYLDRSTHSDTAPDHALEIKIDEIGSYVYQDIGTVRAIVDSFIDHFEGLGDNEPRVIFTLIGPQYAYAYGMIAQGKDGWEGLTSLFAGTIATAVKNYMAMSISWDVLNLDDTVDRYAFEILTDPDTGMQKIAYIKADKIGQMVRDQMLNVSGYPAGTTVNNCQWKDMISDLDVSVRSQAMSSGQMS